MDGSLKFKKSLLILSVLFLASAGYPNTPVVTIGSDAGASVIIQKRRITLVRSGNIARQFPDRRRAVVIYPVIGGPRNSAVLRKVRALLDFKNIFDTSLAEYRSDAWLTEFDYKVNYNKNFILDITFTQSGMGAYPDTHTKHFAINLRSGELIQASDAFTSLDALARLVNQKLQAEIEQVKKENPGERESIEPTLNDLRIDASGLNDLSVNARGVTFIYDAGFPHVIQALEPVGRYFFNFTELKPYIRPDGPLGVFIR